MRRHWLSLCTVLPSHSQISSLSTTILALGKPDVTGSHIWAVGVLTDQGDAMFYQKSLHEWCRMGRRIDAHSLICSLGHCEWDGHTVHRLSQRRLTADLLAPRESGCSRMCSKVSSDWLPASIKATRPVLEIFKMAGYFPDRPRTTFVSEHAKNIFNLSQIHWVLSYFSNNIVPVSHTSRPTSLRLLWGSHSH